MKIKYFILYGLVALVFSTSIKAKVWSGTIYKYYQPTYGFVMLNNVDTVKPYMMYGDRVSNQKNCIFYEDINH